MQALLLSLMLLAAPRGPGVSPQPITLKDAVRSAVENHPDVLRAAADYDSASGQAEERTGQYMPRLTLRTEFDRRRRLTENPIEAPGGVVLERLWTALSRRW